MVRVTPCYPTEVTIILLLQKQASNPQVVSYAALRVKAHFFLPQIDTALGLFENGEGSQRNCVALGDLKMFHFLLLLLYFLYFLVKVLGWIDRTGCCVCVRTIFVKVDCTDHAL